ncbi:MAG: NAD-dependent epimerase/dehydratase family protein [Pseudomonadales bacterium]|nr:NAD-dependent epimerase/dehydratase family protein [Pseudomonadales bacterium]
MDNPSKILVTGGAGFIGSSVVKALLERYPEASVRVMHLQRDNLINLKGLDIELVEGDVTQPEKIQAAVEGCDVVFHLAAVYALWLPDMSVMQRVNVEGTKNVFDACLNAGVKRVVFTSSFACFAGQGQDTACTEQSKFALDYSYYSRTKYEATKLAEAYVKMHGLDIVIVCPTCPIGPGDYGPTPTGRVLVDAFDSPVMMGIHTDSNYIDVRDCATGHVLAYEKGRTGESYILGGENYTHPDVVRRLLRIFGLKRPVVNLKPHWLKPMARINVALAEKGLLKKPPFTTLAELKIAENGLVADASKARRELGLPTRPIEESLQDAVLWFVQNGYIQGESAQALINRGASKSVSTA